MNRESLRRVVPVLLPLAALAVAARVRRRLGATVQEAEAPLPGDELLPAAQVQNDRARTIAAPPAEVWPWIVQLGQEKAGFYSFEFLENLIGCQIEGADRVHQEWQDVAVGDRFGLHPELALRVARVEPGHCLVVTSHGGQAPGEMDFDTTWAFVLSPRSAPDGVETRFQLRERYETRSTSARVMTEVTSVVSAIMTWRMMSRLRTLAGPGRRVSGTPR